MRCDAMHRDEYGVMLATRTGLPRHATRKSQMSAAAPEYDAGGPPDAAAALLLLLGRLQ